MDDVVRLAKPRKKGLLRLVFSRFFLIVGLLVLQVLIGISFYFWLGDLLPYFNVVCEVTVIVGVIYLFCCDMDSSGKLTWMLIIAIVPIAGAILLAWTQTNLGNRTLIKRAKAQIDSTKEALPQPEDARRKIEDDECGTDDLNAYLN